MLVLYALTAGEVSMLQLRFRTPRASAQSRQRQPRHAPSQRLCCSTGDGNTRAFTHIRYFKCYNNRLLRLQRSQRIIVKLFVRINTRMI